MAGAAEAWGADRVVAEVNNGGVMAETTLRSADAALPVRTVSASRGKAARAEPIAALFESGKAKLAGSFPELEDELAGLVAGGGYCGPGWSPDRADDEQAALFPKQGCGCPGGHPHLLMVWAMTELSRPKQAEPRVRSFR